MNKVLLIQPKNYGYSELLGNKHIPLGLLSASTFLSEQYKVKIIDQRFNNWKKILLKELKSDPLCVGVTSITGKQIKSALEVSQLVKEKSNSKLIWGGVHSTLLPEQTLKNSLIDYVVSGEGEKILYNLVNSIDKGSPLENVKGISFKKKNIIKRNKEEARIDINNIDVPFNLIKVKKYIKKSKATTLETSRGCGLGCSFCIKSKYKWIGKSPEKMIDIVNKIVNDYRVKRIWFADDNFFFNLNRIKIFSDNIMKENISLKWDVPGTTLNTLKQMDHKFINKLEKAGCDRLYVGAESGSDNILKMLHKKTTNQEILDINKKFKRSNIKLVYNFMLGFPGESSDDVKETIRLMYRLKKENKNTMISPLYFYTPYPGTEMYSKAKQNGFREPINLPAWSNFEWKNINLPWIKNKRQLERLYFLSLFFDNKYNYELNNTLFKTMIKMTRPIINSYFHKYVKKYIYNQN